MQKMLMLLGLGSLHWRRFGKVVPLRRIPQPAAFRILMNLYKFAACFP